MADVGFKLYPDRRQHLSNMELATAILLCLQAKQADRVVFETAPAGGPRVGNIAAV